MKTLSLIPMLLLSLNLFSQQVAENLQTENLKGSVSSYHLNTFVITPDSDKASLKYSTKHIFDTDGHKISIENFGNDEKLDSKKDFIYTQNELTTIKSTNATGEINKTTQFEYDDKSRLSGEKKLNNKGEVQQQITYLYNNKNLISAKHKLIPSINYTMKETYVYKDNKVSEIIKKARIGTTKEKIEYTTDGLTSKKYDYNAMGELYSVIVYTYNKNKDRTDLKKYDADNKMTYYESYEYKYDSHNNWIERVSFEKGKKVSIDKREIKY